MLFHMNIGQYSENNILGYVNYILKKTFIIHIVDHVVFHLCLISLIVLLLDKNIFSLKINVMWCYVFYISH